MGLLEAIQNRVSCAVLSDPAPSKEQLNQLLKAAVRAPDHGALTPWRFIAISGEKRQKFADVLHAIKMSENAPPRVLLKAQKGPMRAPMILVVVAAIQDCKIPAIEQEYSAAAAAQNILLAAHVQNLGAIWRTGWPTFHPEVHSALHLTKNEKIVGFIYLGAATGEKRPITPLNPEDYLQIW